MFERFTEEAREVVVAAQEEARVLRHNYVGGEHFLIALAREREGLAARALASLGVNVDDARAQVAETVGLGTEPRSGQIPFSPGARSILENSLRESLSLGHNHIGTEHLLLGLLADLTSTAVAVLQELGAEPDAVREELLALLESRSPADLRRKLQRRLAVAEALLSAARRREEVARAIAESEDRASAVAAIERLLDLPVDVASAVVDMRLALLTRADVRLLEQECRDLTERLRSLPPED